MDYLRKREIQRRLELLTDKEWKDICDRCKKAINTRLYNKTEWGAHSIKELGAPAVDHYLNTSIEKIYSFQRDWKFEDRTITEELIRISNSLISHQLEAYKSRINGKYIEVDLNDDLRYKIFDDIEDDKHIDELINCIENLVKEDGDLEFYWEAIKDRMKSREIAVLMEKPINRIYKLNDKLIYQAKTKCLAN
ncbi:MAG: hypothetical protein GQ574_04120 [Crocinitomix sp.]|nr:hypothetical protein [Crocinitomix sp.]